MASSRSDLRIRAVPLIPSSAATACNSGSRMAERLPRRAPAPLADGPAGSAGPVAVAAESAVATWVVSVTKGPSPPGGLDQVAPG
jgi:hypothetical protein